MRKSALILGLAAALSAGAASAQGVSPGIAQLAAQAGVDAAHYSADEVIALWNAKRDNDAAAPYAAPAHGVASNVTLSSGGAAISAGHAQLAAQLGVDPAEYSIAQIIALKDARADN